MTSPDPQVFSSPPAPAPIPAPAPRPGALHISDEPDAAIRDALQLLKSLLIENEHVLAYAVQRRIFALTHRRVLVAATTGRLIEIRRGFFGGFTPQTVRWQDVQDVTLKAGIFGMDMWVRYFDQPDMASNGVLQMLYYEGLRKAPGSQVYRIIQAQEQSWREKRRQREIEEIRARSGGIVMGMPTGTLGLAPSPAPSSQGDPVTRLHQLKDMLDKHLISDSEYETAKARIVNQL
jgi:hypothetical protein